MKNYNGKREKFHCSVYLNESQNNFVQDCVEKYGMKKSEVIVRLAFANSTAKDPRFYNLR
jgi:hypothetical protein